MSAQPPNRDLAALPDLLLLDPKNRAFVEGHAPHIAGRTLSGIGGVLTGFALLGFCIVAFLWWIGVVDAICLIGLLLAAIITFGARLVRESNFRQAAGGGTLLRGEVISFRFVEHGPYVYEIQLDYAFVNPAGIRRFGVNRKFVFTTGSILRYPPETPLAVLYVDDKHHKVL
jgi:hypothetical protein